MSGGKPNHGTYEWFLHVLDGRESAPLVRRSNWTPACWIHHTWEGIAVTYHGRVIYTVAPDSTATMRREGMIEEHARHTVRRLIPRNVRFYDDNGLWRIRGANGTFRWHHGIQIDKDGNILDGGQNDGSAISKTDQA